LTALIYGKQGRKGNQVQYPMRDDPQALYTFLFEIGIERSKEV